MLSSRTELQDFGKPGVTKYTVKQIQPIYLAHRKYYIARYYYFNYIFEILKFNSYLKMNCNGDLSDVWYSLKFAKHLWPTDVWSPMKHIFHGNLNRVVVAFKLITKLIFDIIYS